MHVLVLTTQIPFTKGGAEIHADSLVAALRREGHEAEIVSIPFKWYPSEKILDHLLACRLLDITEANGQRIDRVIGLRFPAYHIPHPNKVMWVMHQHRMAFDLWGQPECDIALSANGKVVRDAIEKAERTLMPDARAIYANSKNVAARLEKYCGVKSEALYHPPRGAERFHGGDAGDFFYYPGRICELKRQELVIRAIAHTKQPVRVVFSGKADNPDYFERLKTLAIQLHVDARIHWAGLVSDERMIDLYATCLCVLYPAKDEDYGYVPLEAMLSSKSIVTCHDSGGPLEFVRDGATGLVCDADEDALAASMDRLWLERKFAAEAGLAGRASIDELDINWKHVVGKLLA